VIARPVAGCLFCGTGTYNSKYCCEACEVLDSKFSAPAGIVDDHFSYLDQPNFKNKFRIDDGAFDYQLYVELSALR
jgi:hypothetical protein